MPTQLTAIAPKYTIYTALLSQSGAAAPTAAILNNTIGNVIWTRVAVGRYRGTLAGAFIENQTIVFINNEGLNGSVVIFMICKDSGSPNYVLITTADEDGTLTDGLLFTTSIEIRIYQTLGQP